MIPSSSSEESPETPVAGNPTSRSRSYERIVKSSLLIGGMSVVSIAFGIVRTKAMAMWLGPAGIGLVGIYSSIVDLTQSVAGMGINNSGVRQIAEAVGSGDLRRVAQTAAVLRRTAYLLGLLGAVIILLFHQQIAAITFGDRTHASAVSFLSLAVLFALISGGQAALIQGMCRIADLAKMGVLGAMAGTAASIALVFFFGEKGVAPSLVAVAATSIATSWWYSRKIELPVEALPLSLVREKAAALLKLGMAFMASALLTVGAAYVIRLLVIRSAGLNAAGMYQSAWTLGGLYVGFILQSMGADFFPRLTAAAMDNAECNRLVNEQAQVSLLVAAPGAIATLTFTPLFITLFYSEKFGGAVDILRWICLGMTLRVAAWPMGFILLAKGARAIFFWTEVAATLVHVGLAWLLLTRFGLSGVGTAFFGLYIWHSLLIYFIVRRLSGFRWSPESRRLLRLFLPVIAGVFCCSVALPFWTATTIGAAATLASAAYSLRSLMELLPPEKIPHPIRQWFLLRPSE